MTDRADCTCKRCGRDHTFAPPEVGDPHFACNLAELLARRHSRSTPGHHERRQTANRADAPNAAENIAGLVLGPAHPTGALERRGLIEAGRIRLDGNIEWHTTERGRAELKKAGVGAGPEGHANISETSR